MLMVCEPRAVFMKAASAGEDDSTVLAVERSADVLDGAERSTPESVAS